MMHVKKNDKVKVMIGKDKGKEGVVVEVLPTKGKVLVKGIALKTRHTKARRQGDVAGIKQEEAYIDASNVQPICTACKLPSRVNAKLLENNKRVRICNRCKEII
jgi:large subunit ribosomal protein L24